MTNSDKCCTCHPELYRHQCTYPIFFQWSPESWLRARFEACRWGQCTIHLQARGVWAQTPVKVCSMQQKPEASLSRTLTVSEVWDQERVCWSSTHIFQKIPRHWGENESCVFLHDAANHVNQNLQHPVRRAPQVKDTRRCFLVPGKQGSPKVWVSARTEQFALPWHLRDTFLRADGDKHSAVKIRLVTLITWTV